MEGEPEAYRDDSLKSIGISPKERLERIEAMLEKIDTKLDGKANQSALVALEVRVKTIEVCVEKADVLKEETKTLQSLYNKLHDDHEALKNRIAYYFGGIAVAAIVAEMLFGHFIG